MIDESWAKGQDLRSQCGCRVPVQAPKLGEVKISEVLQSRDKFARRVPVFCRPLVGGRFRQSGRILFAQADYEEEVRLCGCRCIVVVHDVARTGHAQS